MQPTADPGWGDVWEQLPADAPNRLVGLFLTSDAASVVVSVRSEGTHILAVHADPGIADAAGYVEVLSTAVGDVAWSTCCEPAFGVVHATGPGWDGRTGYRLDESASGRPAVVFSDGTTYIDDRELALADVIDAAWLDESRIALLRRGTPEGVESVVTVMDVDTPGASIDVPLTAGYCSASFAGPDRLLLQRASAEQPPEAQGACDGAALEVLDLTDGSLTTVDSGGSSVRTVSTDASGTWWLAVRADLTARWWGPDDRSGDLTTVPALVLDW